jgi:hypothetical protein
MEQLHPVVVTFYRKEEGRPHETVTTAYTVVSENPSLNGLAHGQQYLPVHMVAANLARKLRAHGYRDPHRISIRFAQGQHNASGERIYPIALHLHQEARHWFTQVLTCSQVGHKQRLTD